MTTEFQHFSKYDPLKVEQQGRPLLYSDLKEGAAHAPKPEEVVIIVAESRKGLIASDDISSVKQEITRGQGLINEAPTLADAIELVSHLDSLTYRGLFAVPKDKLNDVSLG